MENGSGLRKFNDKTNEDALPNITDMLDVTTSQNQTQLVGVHHVEVNQNFIKKLPSVNKDITNF